MKKICIVTGGRSDYGLLKNLMQGIVKNSSLKLQLIVTGMHLSGEHGLTIEQIESDGIKIDYVIETQLGSDTPVGVTKSMGLGLIGYADAYRVLNPDLIIVLGDRYEICCAAMAALIFSIPIAHLHGGEITTGSIDESMRHAITKMATIHMVATEESRKRIIQMGEHPKFVFNVGGLGVDNISKMKLLTKSEIEKKLKFKFLKNNFLVTFHPATNNTKNSITHFDNLLSILSKYQDTRIIFTLPNSDVGSRLISKKIHEFVELHKNAIAFSALGDLNYLSIVKLVDMVIGNSSSGLLEVPALRVPTINIGDRQLGRERATSVLDVNGSVFQIDDAIRKIYSKKINILKIYNPYGNGGANSLIIKIISSIVNKPLKKQKFFDIKFEVEK